MSTEQQNFFEISEWRQLRDSCKSFNDQEETKIVLNVQKSLLLFDKLSDDEVFQTLTPEQKDFFINNFTLQFTKDLLNHSQYKGDNFIIIEQIIFKVLYLIVKLLPRDVTQLSEAFKQIFELTRPFYKNNNQDEKEKMALGFQPSPCAKRQEWTESLKQGDIIDAIKQEKGYKQSCWSRAQILCILDNYNEVKLGFLNEYERNDCYINLNSCDIAELGTMSIDYEWRENLQKGDLLDVCDTISVWYNSTVLDRKKRVGERGDEIIEVKIGYRVYDSAGTSLDENGQPYTGWSERYDDWFTISSPRIQKLNKMAKKFSKAASQPEIEEFLDDSMDIIHERTYQERPLCGIIRHHLPLADIPSNSVSLIKFMNFFLEQKGFEGIIQRINDRENWLSFEILTNYMQAIGALNRVYLRQFCIDFIPKLWESVRSYMLEMPDFILRTVDNKQDLIFKSLDVLIKRPFSVFQKQEMVEGLYLQFSSKCFNCDFLQQKILGLKMMTQLLTNVRTNTFRYFTNASIKSWMKETHIFDSIFTQDSHAQVIQRSVEVLKFMITGEMISQRSLNVIWQLINSNSSSKEKNQSIFKVLYEISPSFQPSQVEHILKMIEEMEVNHIQVEHINLIHELFGPVSAGKNSPYHDRALNALWQIFTNSQIAEQIADKALQQFLHLGKCMESSESKYGFITKCLQNIQNNVSVSQSIRIMKQLIESYPPQSSHTVETYPPTVKYCTLTPSQESIVAHICSHYDINKLILENIKNIKRQAKIILSSQNKDFQGYLIQYLGKLEDRINIVKFINSLQDGRSVDLEILSLLWEELITNQIIQQESDLMFKWLREFNSDKNVSTIEQFYTEKMLQSEIFIKSLTINGFECFQSLFIMINQQQNKIVQKSMAEVQKQYVYSMSSQEYQLPHHSPKEDDQGNIFRYQCDVNPKELSGINRIWDFVELVEDSQVATNALQFLIKLYQNFTPLMQPQLHLITNEYLEKCFSKLNQENSRGDRKQDKIRRILTMIQKFQEESEVNGISGLKSHSGLIKGEQQTIQIINELTTISNQEKKFDLKIYSNKTIFDLKIEIARKIKLSWDTIRLKRFSNDDIQDSDNGKTIGDMRFKNNEILTVVNRQTEYIPQAVLLDQDGNLLEKPKAIFKKWFEIHSLPNGLMDQDLCAKFISFCTNDICKGDDSRVKDVFQQMDDDNDGFLTLSNFLNFYQNACKNRLNTVWKNLQTHGYRNDLKDNDELAQEEVDIVCIPRFILMQNQQFYDILFDLINLGQNDACSLQIWQILQNIPTSRKIQEMIVKLEGIKNQQVPDWSKIFDESLKNKMLYILSIIEYLMEDEDEDQLPEKQEAQQVLSTELQERKKNNSQILQNFVIKKTNEWRSDFIFYGGFEQLFKVFQKYVKVDQPTLIEKQILQFILKIIKNYLTATLFYKVKHIYKIANYARLALYPLDVIDQNLKEDDDINYVKQDDLLKVEDPPSKENDEEKELKESKTDNHKEEDKSKEDKSSSRRQQQKIKETKDFLILSEKLQGELGDKIIQTLNINQLMNEIINIILNIIKDNSELESEDRLIIDFGLSILVTIIMQNDNNIENFLKNPNSTQFLISGIFHTQLNVRKVFRNSMYLILRQLRSAELYIWLISLSIENLPTEKFEQRRECEQYYNLFCKVLEDALSFEGEVMIDYEKVLNQIIGELHNHTSTEKRSNSSKNDKILIGFLDLIERIIKIKPMLCLQLGELGLYLFNTCLFSLNSQTLLDVELCGIKLDESLEVNPHNYVKCKQQQSRKTAYKILNQMFINNKQLRSQFFNACLLPLFDSLPMPTEQNYKPSTNSRSYLKFSGIKNLGATCYMNSILQQFYMTETFRYLILSMDDKVADNLVPYSGKQKEEVGKPVDDNILHQFQNLFAFLELTDRQFYNPSHFCFSYKDFDGLPVNVIVQQDAQEFLNRIFEKLESEMKTTPLKYVTENIFGGKTSSLLQCNVCGHVKENVELFYNLSLPVQNMKSIQETLDFMIKGETINDYFCETCQKKQDITKKLCLSVLPNVLIIHLQRIVFDMDTFENKKINSHFEFPHLLNLEPYTKDGLEAKGSETQEAKEDLEDTPIVLQKLDSLRFEPQRRNSKREHPQEYYSYKLKGIVVHTGTAQQGHYYSYIQHKDKNNAQKEKWIEFNDMNIQVFDPKNIPKECFGGQQNSQANNVEDWGTSTTSTDKQERSKCAYVLVYERSSTVCTPLKFQFEKKEDRGMIEDLKIDKAEILQEDEAGLVLDYSGINPSINKKLFSKVWIDNHKFMLEKQIYNEDFFQFILNFVQSIEVPLDYVRKPTWEITPDIYQGWESIPKEKRLAYTQTLDFLYNVVFSIIAKTSDNKILKTLLMEIRLLLNLIPDYAQSWLNKFFIGDGVRKSTIEVLLTSVDKDVRATYGKIINYCVNITIQINNLGLNVEEEGTICGFYLHCVQILNSEVAKNWQKMGQFLDMLRDFVLSGEFQISFAFRNEFIPRLIDFYLGKDSVLPANVYGKKIHQMSNKYSQPDFHSLIQTLAELIPRAYSLNGQPPSIQSIQEYSLDKNGQICLGQMEFYQRILKESQVPYILKIFNHLSRENLEFSREIAKYLLLAFNKSNMDEVKPYLQITNSFLGIEDSLFLQRAEWLLGVPTIRPNKYDNFYICGSLEDMSIRYESTLDNVTHQQTILQTLYEDRRRYENYTVVSLNQFLQLLDTNEMVLSYIVLMPPPNYIVTRYIDWIKAYLLEYISDAKKYSSYNQAFNKEKLGEDTLIIYNSIEQKFNAQMSAILGPQSQNESLFKNYIVGGIIDQKLVSNDVIHEVEGNKVFIYQVEYEVYMVNSMPTGSTNLVFPEEIIDKNYLTTINISQDSNIFNLIHNQEKYQASTSLYYLKDPVKKVEEKQQTPKNSADKKILTLNIIQSDQVEPIIQTSKKIDIDDIYQAPFIRKIGVNNETDQTLYINFQINAENPDDINFLFPLSVFKRVVQPKENATLWFINKRDGDLEWGNYSYNCGLSFKQNQQVLSENAIGKKVEGGRRDGVCIERPEDSESGVTPAALLMAEHGPNKKFQEGISALESYAAQKTEAQNPGAGVHFEYDPWQVQDTDIPSSLGGGDKSCLICTFLNPLSSISCMMCGTLF